MKGWKKAILLLLICALSATGEDAPERRGTGGPGQDD